MSLQGIHKVYFIGIGGIGMSALARYFVQINCLVAGYDKTPTELTKTLESEGINIHFTDNTGLIPDAFKIAKGALIIYTPAIPDGHLELNFFRSKGFKVVKRSQALGIIVNKKQGIGVAGTHGKTTVSTMIAHLLKNSSVDCSAFLGGISKNYASNYLVSKSSPYVVVEADEFDRSFLQLDPAMAVITSIDPDHLDIYKDHAQIIKTFNEYVARIKTGGILFVNKKVASLIEPIEKINIFSYSLEERADFYAKDLRLENGLYYFTLVAPTKEIKDINLGIPGKVNLENAVVAIAVALQCGISAHEIKEGLSTFKGVERRMDLQFHHTNLVYIDDYAHHPEELRRTISSVREIYADRKITGIFQPHLFTRTNDFYKEFAHSLDLLDEAVLLDIYPARELPVLGVTSDLILGEMRLKNKVKCSKNELIHKLKHMNFEVLLTLGAGDIDTLVPGIVSLCKIKAQKMSENTKDKLKDD